MYLIFNNLVESIAFLVRATLCRNKSLIDQYRDFLKAPYVVGNASSHRGRDSQSLVDPGEIVMHEVQRNHVPVVLQFLTESVGQAGKAAIRHPHRKVLTLH